MKQGLSKIPRRDELHFFGHVNSVNLGCMILEMHHAVERNDSTFGMRKKTGLAAERYDSGQNAAATKTYCQDYGVALPKVECDFQDNKGIDTVCILVERDDEPETLTLTQTQMIWTLQRSRYIPHRHPPNRIQ